MSTITPSPTLDPDWTPSVYGCNRKGDFWIWDYHAQNDQRTVLGGPSQTTNCLPSTWDPSRAYAGTQCPTGYTSACLSTGSSATPTTTVCCPTVYSFSCVDNASKNPHGPWFPCMSQYDYSTKRRVTVTDFAANTIDFKDVNQGTNLHLFAMGISHTSPTATDPADSSATPSPSDTSEPSSSSSISAGAAAGIGVGSAAGVMLIALLGWFLLRRRRKEEADAPPVAGYPVQVGDTKEMPSTARPQELYGDTARELPG
ncbi:hypothetical protein ANOM_002560 [Aspergillus nomiae NRRL 13137]|uniref:Uncharacterized protein n=1 Tax=Aspergillus nomiae NRRL (strain ATCC 15546 / NRRL 13137 / CBS 260.88 / M93) TaxID=1509407 RepID=A0A0L1JBU6_ASPN3|nr:uncharacterized protein ANOM_002560 [Aspergillus nomiae NRRL 13137]KNG89197.1 hypothetical protein ANOM_002560 [Aspergillus nomiae NRRL 13137]